MDSPVKTHENEVLHLCLALFLEISYLAWKLTFDLEYTKMLKLSKLALIGFEFTTKKSVIVNQPSEAIVSTWCKIFDKYYA